MNAALGVILAFFAIAIALGMLARRGVTMTLEQWTVGGRGFGTIFVFLLMAGEIYTTFTFLGASGWAYGRGAPAFYILAYGAIAYSFSYFLLPVIWRYGTAHKLVSQSDYFVKKYDSRALGLLVSAVGAVAIIPYLVLQLKGLGIIVSEASYGSIAPPTAVWVGSAALVVFVTVSGMKGSAWTAALKDLMILGVAGFLGVYLPVHYYGGYRAMFAAIDRAKPGFFVLPAQGMSPSWFVSTVLLTSLGFYMWPHYFASTYTARNENVFRKSAVLLPLYQLLLLFVFFIGFAAVLQVPALTGADAVLALLRVVKQTFSPAIVGLVGAAGVLTAIVPGSLLLLTCATILAKNLYREAVPSATDAQVTFVARCAVPVIALVSILLTLRGGTTLVPLLLMGYSLVTQLFPAVILSLGARPLVGSRAAFCGILAAEATVAYVTITGQTVATMAPAAPQWVKDLNVGIVAMVVNVTVLGAVSLFTPRRSPAVSAPAAW